MERFSIIIFLIAVPGLSDLARELVKEARDRLYMEWFAYYSIHNIDKACEKVGNTMLLLPAIQVFQFKFTAQYRKFFY